jgi:hypothetical protein
MVKEASEGRNKVTESGEDISELLTIMRLLYSTFAYTVVPSSSPCFVPRPSITAHRNNLGGRLGETVNPILDSRPYVRYEGGL